MATNNKNNKPNNKTKREVLSQLDTDDLAQIYNDFFNCGDRPVFWAIYTTLAFFVSPARAEVWVHTPEHAHNEMVESLVEKDWIEFDDIVAVADDLNINLNGD